MDRYQRRFLLHLNIVRDLGYGAGPGATVLDFGCGKCELVKEYRRNGYRAFGCDPELQDIEDVRPLREKGIIRMMDGKRIPFDDDTFDIVVSNQVLEHVMDYPSALSEIRRVLKPGGVSLHIFPSRYNPIEPHVFVPFASVIRRYPWFLFWALVGLKREDQRRMSAREVARQNYESLGLQNYLTKGEIRGHVLEHFEKAVFCEGYFLKHTHRKLGGFLYGLSRIFPFIAQLFSAFHSRVLFFSEKKPFTARPGSGKRPFAHPDSGSKGDKTTGVPI